MDWSLYLFVLFNLLLIYDEGFLPWVNKRKMGGEERERKRKERRREGSRIEMAGSSQRP